MKNWRVNLFFSIFIILSAIIIGRLIFIQGINGKFYLALSKGLHTSFADTVGERGEIFLSNNDPLAINLDWYYVFVHPNLIEDVTEASEKLAEALDMEKDFIFASLNQDTNYLVLKRKLSEQEKEKISQLAIEGVFLGKEQGRYYPQETLASRLTGFLGIDNEGQYGLEQFYDETLKGKEGVFKKLDGADLLLTIDYDLQFEAEKLLQQAEKDLEVQGGQIIVMNPETGKILTMADLINYDPNYYEKYAKEGNLSIFKDTATQALFEPGSIFKAITMAAALEENKISPNTNYNDTGSVKIGEDTIFNYDQRVHNAQTMTNVLEKSINTGAVFVQKQLGQNLFLKYVEKFGCFEPTGIDIFETYSENRELKTGREINLATASFGQGIEITPIQIVRAYSAIANGGKLVNPYLVEKIQTSDGQITNQPNKSKDIPNILSSKTSSQLTAMLVSVVENGFAKAAGIPGYFIAGKTGTAQVSYGALGIDKKGYSDKTIQSFVGFLPAFNPKFVILVKLDNPKTRTAEYSAVPVFKQLTEFIINHYQIPPDYEE